MFLESVNESWGPQVYETEDLWNADDELRAVEERLLEVCETVAYWDLLLSRTGKDGRVTWSIL